MRSDGVVIALCAHRILRHQTVNVKCAQVIGAKITRELNIALQVKFIIATLFVSLNLFDPAYSQSRNDCHIDQDDHGTYCVFVDTSKPVKSIRISFYSHRQGSGGIVYSGKSLKKGAYLTNDHGYNIRTRIDYIGQDKIVLRHLSGGQSSIEVYLR